MVVNDLLDADVTTRRNIRLLLLPMLGQSHSSECVSSDKAVFGSTCLILYCWRVELMANLLAAMMTKSG